MKNNIYPKNYKSLLDLTDTQVAIKLVKDTFEHIFITHANKTIAFKTFLNGFFCDS